jgi:hypothetical protein
MGKAVAFCFANPKSEEAVFVSVGTDGNPETPNDWWMKTGKPSKSEVQESIKKEGFDGVTQTITTVFPTQDEAIGSLVRFAFESKAKGLEFMIINVIARGFHDAAQMALIVQLIGRGVYDETLSADAIMAKVAIENMMKSEGS